MTDDDLKQIRGVIKDELRPIKGTLDEHSDVLKKHSALLNHHSELFRIQGAVLNDHTRLLEKQGKTLGELSKTVREQGKTSKEHGRKLDAIWDQLVEVSEDLTDEKGRVDSHERRFTRVEKHLGLTSSAK